MEGSPSYSKQWLWNRKEDPSNTSGPPMFCYALIHLALYKREDIGRLI